MRALGATGVEMSRRTDRFSEVRSNLLRSVSKCGARGIFSLRRQLQQYDRDGGGFLDHEELYLALTDFKLAVSEDDVRAIFIELDRDDRGVVNFDQLLDLVAPRLTHDRNAVVAQSFNKVRGTMLGGTDAVDAKVFRDAYDASQHPEVLQGLTTREQAHIEFLDTFNDMFEVRRLVRLADFQGYYQFISAGIQSDQHFTEMVSGCWGVTRPRAERRRSSIGSLRSKSPGRLGHPSHGRSHGTYGRSESRAYDRSSPQEPEVRGIDRHDFDVRRNVQSGGFIEVEVVSGSDPGFKLGDLASVTYLEPNSEVALAHVTSGTHVLKAFQEEPIDPTVDGDFILRTICATPKPWLFTFGPKGVPWSTDKKMQIATNPERPEATMRWGEMGEQHSAAADYGVEILSVSEIMAKVKRILDSRTDGIARLSETLRVMDGHGTYKLNIKQFTKAMNDHRLGLNEAEIDTLFEAYDVDMVGIIHHEAFLRELRCQMNLKRKSVVRAAFQKFDSNSSGEATVEDLMQSGYNATYHPDVTNRKKTERQVLMDMLTKFERGSGDGRVTEEEFVDYHATSVSPLVDNDDHFVTLVRKAWRLDEPSVPVPQQWQMERGASGENPVTGRNLSHEMDTTDRSGICGVVDIDNDATLKRLRETPQLVGNQNMQALKSHFAHYDQDKSGDLNLEEFQRALRDFRVRLSNAEVRRIFMIFDDDRSGAIKYDEFMQGLVGGASYSSQRQAVVSEAFGRFDHDQTGTAALSEIQDGYNATAHPDAKSGKKHEMQVRKEFIDAVDPTKTGQVCVEKFSKYFATLSREIADDEFFEVCITKCPIA